MTACEPNRRETQQHTYCLEWGVELVSTRFNVALPVCNYLFRANCKRYDQRAAPSSPESTQVGFVLFEP